MTSAHNGNLLQHQAHNTTTKSNITIPNTTHPSPTLRPSTPSILFNSPTTPKQKQQTTYQTHHQHPRGTQTTPNTMPSPRITTAFKKAAKLTVFIPFVVAINALPVAATERYGWLSEEELQRDVEQQYEGPVHR